jgi:hypothetical protein
MPSSLSTVFVFVFCILYLSLYLFICYSTVHIYRQQQPGIFVRKGCDVTVVAYHRIRSIIISRKFGGLENRQEKSSFIGL